MINDEHTHVLQLKQITREGKKTFTGISFSLPNVKFQIFFLDKEFSFTCDGLWTGIPPIDWTTSL